MLGGARSCLTVSVCCLEGAGLRSDRPRCMWPASRQLPRACPRSSRSQSGSSEHTGVLELREMFGGTCSRLTVSVCCFEGAGPRSACSPVQVAHQPPAASRPTCASGAPGLSLDPVSTPEFQSSVRCLVAHASGSRSQSAVSRVQVCGPPAPPCRWLPFPGAQTQRLPPPSVHLPISVRSFTASRFIPQ